MAAFRYFKRRTETEFDDGSATTPFMDSLQQAGFAPQHIDRVICSHLHDDHVGWNTSPAGNGFVPTFPNAEVLLPKRDWSYVRSRADTTGSTGFFSTIIDRVQPLVEAGVATFVDGDERLDAFLDLETLSGHTPSHMGLMLNGSHNRAILCGDLLHHPLQCAAPELDRFAVDQKASIAARIQFLKRVADTELYILPTHLAGPGFGRVRSRSKRWVFIGGSS